MRWCGGLNTFLPALEHCWCGKGIGLGILQAFNQKWNLSRIDDLYVLVRPVGFD